MEIDEWLVAAFLVLAGLLAAIGLYWGSRDPSVARYEPSVAGLFQLGRVRAGREDFDEQKPAKDGGQSESK